jgi:hypothetical protein
LKPISQWVKKPIATDAFLLRILAEAYHAYGICKTFWLFFNKIKTQSLPFNGLKPIATNAPHIMPMAFVKR